MNVLAMSVVDEQLVFEHKKLIFLTIKNFFFN